MNRSEQRASKEGKVGNWGLERTVESSVSTQNSTEVRLNGLDVGEFLFSHSGWNLSVKLFNSFFNQLMIGEEQN